MSFRTSLRKRLLQVAVERAHGEAQFALPRGADHLARDVEERLEPDASAVPCPDAAVAAAVAEMLQDVVCGLAGFAPRAERLFARARTREGC